MALDDASNQGSKIASGEGQFPAVYGELTNIFEELVTKLQASLDSKKLDASGRLRASIIFNPKDLGTYYSFELQMNKYGLDVDKGTKPHKVAIEKLMEWIAAKGIAPKFAKGTKKIGFTNKDATKSFAYMIQKSIEKKGTIKRFGYKGSRFYSDVIPSKDEFLKGINARISKALKTDVLVQIKTFK